MAESAAKPRPHSVTLNTPKRHSYRTGLYLDLRVGRINKRTAIGKAHTALLGYLRQFVGESNIITELLISRITFKSLKLYLFESEELSKPLSDMLPVYLSMSNSLRRDLAELDRLAVAPKEQDLMTYLKENYDRSKIKHN